MPATSAWFPSSPEAVAHLLGGEGHTYDFSVLHPHHHRTDPGRSESGKSRRAELLARDWLARSADHRAVLIATGLAWDDEMRGIARHQRDRAERVPGLQTVEEPRDVALPLLQPSRKTLVVVDCLTLWLTHWTMPLGVEAMSSGQNRLKRLSGKRGCYVFGSGSAIPRPRCSGGQRNGWGHPMGREVRAFVDALGTLNQQVAQVCPA